MRKFFLRFKLSQTKKSPKSFYSTILSLPLNPLNVLWPGNFYAKSQTLYCCFEKNVFFSFFPKKFEAAENISVDSKDPNNCPRRRQQQLAAQIVKLGIVKK